MDDLSEHIEKLRTEYRRIFIETVKLLEAEVLSFRPILWQAVQKICRKRSNCFGHFVFRGGGRIREVYFQTGWLSSALRFTV